MASLTLTEEKYLRTKVGSAVELADLQESYDRLGTLDGVAREILETRLADLLADPASFSVPGEYSQDTRANIESIQKLLATLGGASDLGSGGVTVVGPDLPCGR